MVGDRSNHSIGALQQIPLHKPQYSLSCRPTPQDAPSALVSLVLSGLTMYPVVQEDSGQPKPCHAEWSPRDNRKNGAWSTTGLVFSGSPTRCVPGNSIPSRNEADSKVCTLVTSTIFISHFLTKKTSFPFLTNCLILINQNQHPYSTKKK